MRYHHNLVDKNGKTASRKDQRKRANQLLALAVGGGIADLLLPNNSDIALNLKELEKLEKVNKRYRLKRVTSRRPGVRGTARAAVADDEYLAALAHRFWKQSEHSPRLRSAVVREFSKWIVQQLEDPNSEASKLTEHKYPSAELESRQASWWEKQIAIRNKNRELT